MKYEDVETEKMYHQIWYLSWSGASKGQFITNFDNASEKDKTRITDYIKGQGISIFTD
jgi:hypothetical protein